MEQNAQAGSVNVLVKKLGLILSVFVFLLPVFFVGVEGVGLYTAKITLLATGLVAIFAVFLSSVLSTGAIEMPKARYLLPMGIFAIVALASSALSGAIGYSVVGSVFDLGTSGSILMLVFSLFMTVMVVRSVGMVGKVILAFIYSALCLSVYTLFGMFAASSLPASVASKMPLFPAGGVIDTAIILGVAVILSLCAVNMTEVSKRMKIILSVLMAFSILFIGAANFMPVVIILGIISLVFFVYILSWSVGRKFGDNPSEQDIQEPSSGAENALGQQKISLSSLAVLIATVVLLLGGTGMAGYLSKVMKVETAEVRPNFETTMNLTVAAWQKNFVFGIGPNRFAEFWALHKPAEINQTQFWNADFYSGSGFVPTIAITMGPLGLLSLLAFMVLYVASGVKAIFAQANSGRSRYLATASFLVSLYLWIVLFLYTPSVVVLALAFIFTGLFTTTLVSQGIVGLWRINIFSNPKTNFLSVLSIVILLIMSIAGGYFVWERAASSVAFQKGILEYQNTGNIPLARESMVKAIGIAESDIYWRGLAEISLADLGGTLSGITDQSQITDTIKVKAQGLIADAVESAKKATEADNGNFANWFALGRVYEVLSGNGVQGSLESARGAYAEAALRSPGNPSVPLALARLDAMAGNIPGARENIGKALALKNNYTDAYYTLAQLEAASNNVSGAIRSVEAAAIVDPNNTGLYFQLGLLKYNQKDFAGAASAFERAVVLVPDYANAKYFLGLSYYQTGKKAEALRQFQDLSASNPDNNEIKLIITNLEAGRSPFTNAKPPVDNKPEKRSEPPIEE